jgi:hypothetical protein
LKLSQHVSLVNSLLPPPLAIVRLVRDVKQEYDDRVFSVENGYSKCSEQRSHIAVVLL